MQRNVLVAFLASPSDLEEERRVAKDVVQRINRIFGKNIGWQVELRGWEDVLPGHQRPQDLINRDVDECELFIGMLWARWGTPTAQFSSGFHEEFDRVKGRWTTTKTPEIWLLFRKIDPERLKDVGPQLQKVLDFRNDQVSRNELLFKEFESPSEFGALLYDLLAEFLLRLSQKQTAQAESESNKPPEAARQGRLLDKQPDDSAPEQSQEELSAVFERAARSIRKPLGQFDLSFEDRARLLIASTAWFSAQHADELLGIHELHIAHRNRKRWQMSAMERHLLFRTMVADLHDVRAGWYWERDQSIDYLSGFLQYLATNDKKEEVRRGAVNICGRLAIEFDREDLATLLGDDSEQVVSEAIRHIGKRADVSLADLLKSKMADGPAAIRDLAGTVFFDLLYARDPSGAIREFLATGGKPASWLNRARAKDDVELDVALLKEALNRPETSIRAYAAERLRMRGSLDRAAWQQLLRDSDEEIREIAVRALVGLGERFDWTKLNELFPAKRGLLGLSIFGGVDKEALREEQLQLEADGELLGALDFYDVDGAARYGIVADRNFGLVADRIRADLHSEFGNLRKQTEDRLRKNLEPVADQFLAQWKPEITEKIHNEFIAVALRSLAKHALAEDAAIARRYITRTRFPGVVFAAAALLRVVGDASDTELFLNAMKSFWGEKKQFLATSAIELGKNPVGVVRRLLASNDAKYLAGPVASALRNLGREEAIAVANEMIRSSIEDIRKCGAAVLVDLLAEAELELTLDDYDSQSSYFYDVVTLFDRALYAPADFGGRYKAEIRQLRT